MKLNSDLQTNKAQKPLLLQCNVSGSAECFILSLHRYSIVRFFKNSEAWEKKD